MKRLLTLLSVLGALCACEKNATLFVGTYSDGFYAYDFDLKKGDVLPGEPAKAPMPNPSFLAIDGNKVYAVSEMPDSTASVWAWQYGGNGFALLGSQPTGLPDGGEDPCYVATDGRLLAVANYSGGSLAVYKLKAHVHCALFTPDNQLLFTEFSADAISSVDVTPLGVSNYRKRAQLPADFGPRHLLLSGNRLYCIGELSGDIAVYAYPQMALLQVVKADEADARGAADLHLSPDGKFLYASLRLQNDGIALFHVNPDGTLEKVGYQHTGAHPRNFTVLDHWILVACRDTDQIEIYSRDKKSGSLQDTGRRIQLPRPVFVGIY